MLSSPRSRLLILALALALAPAACKKDDDAAASSESGAPVELMRLRLDAAPLEIKIPTTWYVENIDPGEVPPAPSSDGGTANAPPVLNLTGRLIFAATAPESARGKKYAKPRLQIFHDPWIPAGTTAVDYLAAQRSQNEAAIRSAGAGTVSEIRHVEAERSRRQGRPAYMVRDEWDYGEGELKTRVSQSTLLLINQEGEALHGYALVVTLINEDLDALAPVVRQILDTVRFADE